MKTRVCPNCLIPRKFTNGLCEYCGTPVEWSHPLPKEGKLLLHCPDNTLRWFTFALFEQAGNGTMPKLRKHCEQCQQCGKPSWFSGEAILKDSENLGHLLVELRRHGKNA